MYTFRLEYHIKRMMEINEIAAKNNLFCYWGLIGFCGKYYDPILLSNGKFT
jgi:hypothetical protein